MSDEYTPRIEFYYKLKEIFDFTDWSGRGAKRRGQTVITYKSKRI